MEVKRTRVFLNGRFLTQPITGVQRTACELVMALDGLLNDGLIDESKYEFILIYSGEIINHIELKHVALMNKGVLKANLWEQFELPFYTWGNLLISMCTVSTIVKKKQIVFVHDASFLVNPQFFGLLFRTWYKFAVVTLGKIADQIVTVSHFSKNELIKYAGFQSKKIEVIYNSAEHILRFGEPSMDFKTKILSAKPYCLAVSSQSANKNFAALSQAIKKINFSNYNMIIAGGVSPTLQRAKADDSVTYLGYVSNEELKYLYANASLFIFPSFYEGFGIPPLEAMISGCAVISSNTSSLPEVLGDACYYFDPSDVQSMANNIKSLISDETNLKALKQKGYQQAEKYSWKKSAFQLYELIKKLN